MKRWLVVTLIACVMFSATACSQSDGSQNMSSTAIDEQSNSNSVSTNEETSAVNPKSVDSDNSANNTFEKLTGEVIPIADQTPFSANKRIGTKEELDAWNKIIADSSDDNVARIVISDIASSASELTTEQANSIMQILKNAELETYSQIANPATGGTVHVIAYDLNDKMMWHVSFDDYWFIVEQENDGNVCIFNGEGTDLTELKNFA